MTMIESKEKKVVDHALSWVMAPEWKVAVSQAVS